MQRRPSHLLLLAAALVAVSGTIGIIIPPSIPMIVYAFVGNVSVRDLFLAGFIPGLLFGVAALLVRWLIVLPLKGEGIAEGFVPNAMVVYVGFHLIFGIGLALLLASGLALARPQPEPAPRALRR